VISSEHIIAKNATKFKQNFAFEMHDFEDILDLWCSILNYSIVFTIILKLYSVRKIYDYEKKTMVIEFIKSIEIYLRVHEFR
jgi:hypothetical protein